MTRFAIIDDDDVEMEITKGQVDVFCSSHNINEYSIDCFRGSLEFLSRQQSFSWYDVYILDIVMPDVSGIELGSRLKSQFKDCGIILLTTSREYAIESYDIPVIDYCLKPCSQDRLDKAILRVLEKNQPLRPDVDNFVVNIQGGVYSVPPDEIFYVEYYNHRLVVYLPCGKRVVSVSQRIPFSTLIEPLIKSGIFVRTSASFLINMKYIERLRSNEFELVGGKVIPISRTYSSSRGEYMDFILGRGKK